MRVEQLKFVIFGSRLAAQAISVRLEKEGYSFKTELGDPYANENSFNNAVSNALETVLKANDVLAIGLDDWTKHYYVCRINLNNDGIKEQVVSQYGNCLIGRYNLDGYSDVESWAKYCAHRFLIGREAIPFVNKEAPQSESDLIDKQPHYTNSGIEPIELMRKNFSVAEFEGFLKGNVLKYMLRYQSKNGVEDLKKAKTYLTWLIEHNEK